MLPDNPLKLPVVLLSHRGPASFRRLANRRTVKRGGGGLVTALVGLTEQLSEAVWVCAASTEEDAAVAAEHNGESIPLVMKGGPRVLAGDESQADGPVLHVRMVELDPAAKEDFYAVISNPLLWFIQHGLYDLTRAPNIGTRERDAFEHGYVNVNQASPTQWCVSRAARRQGARHAARLPLLPGRRNRAERCPDVVLSHFVHIPWPGPDAWRILPPEMRERLMRGLLGNDVVAFHTERFARNFLLCAQELLGLSVNIDRMTVQVGPRTVTAKTYPISIDVDALVEAANSKVDARPARRPRAMDRRARAASSSCGSTAPTRRRTSSAASSRSSECSTTIPSSSARSGSSRSSSRAGWTSTSTSGTSGEIGSVVARINAKYTRGGGAPIDLRLHEDFPTRRRGVQPSATW